MDKGKIAIVGNAKEAISTAITELMAQKLNHRSMIVVADNEEGRRAAELLAKEGLNSISIADVALMQVEKTQHLLDNMKTIELAPVPTLHQRQKTKPCKRHVYAKSTPDTSKQGFITTSWVCIHCNKPLK